MKRSNVRHGPVCIMCGKPSKQRICETCKVKVEAQAIRRELEDERSDNSPINGPHQRPVGSGT